MRVTRLVAAKSGELVGVLLAVSFFSFLLLSLVPGDPTLIVAGANPSPEQLEQVREELGLNDPLPLRYLAWLGDAVQGDLGRSPQRNQEVTEALGERLPVTLELMLLTIFIGVIAAIPLGSFAALKAGGRFDKFVTTASFGLLAIPGFMMAIGLIIIFAVKLNWLPATGYEPFSENPVENLRRMVLPVLSLVLGEIAILTRVIRSDVIGVLQSDYVETARAKGLTTRRIMLRHALPSASLSLLTLVGLQLAGAVTGALVIEAIFALPGVGTMLFTAILTRDLVLVQGTVLVVAAAYVLINFVVDLSYSLADPRIRRA
ncbi:MAG: ABC transporter permease [Actinomycetota bacterium]|nr:ABC transporter permease [Actinomycetota bacterium]